MKKNKNRKSVQVQETPDLITFRTQLFFVSYPTLHSQMLEMFEGLMYNVMHIKMSKRTCNNAHGCLWVNALFQTVYFTKIKYIFSKFALIDSKIILLKFNLNQMMIDECFLYPSSHNTNIFVYWFKLPHDHFEYQD